MISQTSQTRPPSFVIARSKATKQSILGYLDNCRRLDCRVALCTPRNDDKINPDQHLLFPFFDFIGKFALRKKFGQNELIDTYIRENTKIRDLFFYLFFTFRGSQWGLPGKTLPFKARKTVHS